jgi:aspartate/methionine/tyrosine aminotransferase
LYAKAGVKGSIEFCEKLLNEARVVCVPGKPFGNDKAMRLSYATSTERIREGLSRLESFAKNLG